HPVLEDRRSARALLVDANEENRPIGVGRDRGHRRYCDSESTSWADGGDDIDSASRMSHASKKAGAPLGPIGRGHDRGSVSGPTTVPSALGLTSKRQWSLPSPAQHTSSEVSVQLSPKSRPAHSIAPGN